MTKRRLSKSVKMKTLKKRKINRNKIFKSDIIDFSENTQTYRKKNYRLFGKSDYSLLENSASTNLNKINLKERIHLNLSEYQTTQEKSIMFTNSDNLIKKEIRPFDLQKANQNMDIFLSYEPLSKDIGFSINNKFKTSIINSPKFFQNEEEFIHSKNKYFSEKSDYKKLNKICLSEISHSNNIKDNNLLIEMDYYGLVKKDKNFIIDATNDNNLETKNIIDSDNKIINLYHFNSVISNIEKNVQLSSRPKQNILNWFNKENNSDYISNYDKSDLSKNFLYKEVNENNFSNSNLFIIKNNEFIVNNSNQVKNIFKCTVNNDLIQNYNSSNNNNNSFNFLVKNHELIPQNNYNQTEYSDFIKNISQNFSRESQIENKCKDKLYTNNKQNIISQNNQNNSFDMSYEENQKKIYSNESNFCNKNKLIQTTQNHNDKEYIIYSKNLINNNDLSLENNTNIKFEEFNLYQQFSTVEATIPNNDHQSQLFKGENLDLINELPYPEKLIEIKDQCNLNCGKNFEFYNNGDTNSLSLQGNLLQNELSKNITQSRIVENNFYHDHQDKCFANSESKNSKNEGIFIEKEYFLENENEEDRNCISDIKFNVHSLDGKKNNLNEIKSNNQENEFIVVEENPQTKINIYKPKRRYHSDIENDYNETRFLYEKDMNSWMKKNCSYMENQVNLKPRMRKILLDWINEVSSQLNFKRGTFHLSIALLDTFLSNQPNLEVDKLQLTGVTCLMIAAKYEEILIPSLQQMANATAGACTQKDIIQFESLVLKTLEWKIDLTNFSTWINETTKNWDEFVENVDIYSNQLMLNFELLKTFKFRNKTEKGIILFRKFCQYIDIISFDVEYLMYFERILCLSLIYLLILEYFNMIDLSSKDYLRIEEINKFNEFNWLYDRFLNNFYSLEFANILEHIQFTSCYFGSALHLEVNNLDENSSWEENLQIQIYNPDNFENDRIATIKKNNLKMEIEKSYQ